MTPYSFNTLSLTAAAAADEPKDLLLRQISELFLDSKFSDLTIKCQNNTYPVHQNILCGRSEFFMAACQGGFKESETKVINLDHDDAHAVRSMLEYFYKLDYVTPYRELLALAVQRAGGTASAASITTLKTSQAYPSSPAAKTSSSTLSISKATSSTPAAAPRSLFGGAPTPSSFTSASSAPATTTSIFAPAPLTPATTTSIFAPTPSAPATTTNIFAPTPLAPATTTSLFAPARSTPATTTSLFAPAPSTPATRPSLFSSTSAAPSAGSRPFAQRSPSKPANSFTYTTPPLNQSAGLLHHAKVYAIADKLGVNGLESVALAKFIEEIRESWSATQDFIEAARYIYTETPESNRKMRDVVVDTLLQHQEMMGMSSVQEMVREVDGMSFDLLQKTMKFTKASS